MSAGDGCEFQASEGGAKTSLGVGEPLQMLNQSHITVKSSEGYEILPCL